MVESSDSPRSTGAPSNCSYMQNEEYFKFHCNLTPLGNDINQRLHRNDCSSNHMVQPRCYYLSSTVETVTQSALPVNQHELKSSMRTLRDQTLGSVGWVRRNRKWDKILCMFNLTCLEKTEIQYIPGYHVQDGGCQGMWDSLYLFRPLIYPVIHKQIPLMRADCAVDFLGHGKLVL